MLAAGNKFLLCIIFLFQFICLGKQSAFSFISAETEFNKHYIGEYKMKIYNQSTTADVYFHIIRKFPINMGLRIVAKIRNQVMFQCEFKSCEFEKKSVSRFAGFLLPWLKKALGKANFPNKCPYEEGNYSWTGMNLHDLNIPSFMPKGQYEITTFCFIQEKRLKSLLANLRLVLEMK